MMTRLRRHLTAGPVSLLVLLGLVATATGQGQNQGLTTCSSTNVDWYTNVAGETPCTTYQRLRQICNADYRVGTLTRNTPPDHCDDQLGDCCCNSIAFGLSMLCLACQDNTSNGFDAGRGALDLYYTRSSGTNKCGTPLNKALPTAVQLAVCNQRIKIEDALYGLFWDSGEWFYVFTRDTITKDHFANNNNTFTHCESTWNNVTSSSMSSSATSTLTSTSTSKSSSASTTASSAPLTTTTPTKSISTGAIVGIAIAAVVLIASLGLAFFFWRRRQRRQAAARRRESFDQGPPMTQYDDDGDHDPTSGGPASHFTSTYPAPESAYTIEPWQANAESSTNHNNRTSPGSALGGGMSKGEMLRAERARREGGGMSSVGAPTMYAGSSSWGDESERSMAEGAGGSGLHGRNASSANLIFSERHEDAGPMLGRSASGRLPPAYNDLARDADTDADGIGAVDGAIVSDLQSSRGEGSVAGGGSASGSNVGRSLSTRKLRS